MFRLQKIHQHCEDRSDPQAFILYQVPLSEQMMVGEQSIRAVLTPAATEHHILVTVSQTGIQFRFQFSI